MQLSVSSCARVASAVVAFSLLSGCGQARTGGRRIEVSTRIQGEALAQTRFENDLGWTIELTRARVALDHLYYVTGESVGANLWNPFVSVAYAHPGHYDAGEVLAEMTDHVAVDLLAEPRALPSREAVTGSAHSAVVAFGALGDGSAVSDAGISEGETVEVEGHATSGASRVEFRATVATSDLLHADSSLPEVEGCPFDGELSESGTVTCEVRPSVWLDQVDFTGFSSNATTQVTFARGSEQHNALVRGVRKAIAYSFAFESED